MLKKYTNKHLFTALLLSVWPLQSVQADVIYFDIEATQRYENVHEFTVDGQYIPSYNYSNIDPQQFQSSINFNLFSPENISLTAMEHEFEDNGNTLAWWMTTFNFDPQNIFTLFEDELLGMVDQNAYEWVDAQYQIFAGGTADAFTLFERFEAKLELHQGHLMRAAVELAKDWRTDRMLRKLEALLAVADANTSLIITGNGDVVQPEHDLIAIGSGGPYAQAAATALLQNTQLSARDIVEKSLTIAGDICVYTNHHQTIEEL